MPALPAGGEKRPPGRPVRLLQAVAERNPLKPNDLRPLAAVSTTPPTPPERKRYLVNTAPGVFHPSYPQCRQTRVKRHLRPPPPTRPNPVAS